MIQFLKEFGQFIKERKLLILLPVILVIVLVGVLVFVTSNSAVAPFIYTLF